MHRATSASTATRHPQVGAGTFDVRAIDIIIGPLP
jgi:hypothetical protein